MTGFGSFHFEDGRVSIHVQIKTVNGRFLEVRNRMPREYGAIESEFKKIMGKYFSRGTVDVSVNRTYLGKGVDVEVTPNLPLAQSWLKAAKKLTKELGLDSEISNQTLLRVPDLMQVGELREIPNWEKQAALKAFEGALKACSKEREREGAALAKILSAILDQISKFIDSVKDRKEIFEAQIANRIRERIKALGETLTVDPQRLAQEVLFTLDKSDIAEEIARAETHVKAYRQALKESESVGKKLDFYTQELHREVNTMGSKTQALDVTIDIIEAKTLVERLREQVQNVE